MVRPESSDESLEARVVARLVSIFEGPNKVIGPDGREVSCGELPEPMEFDAGDMKPHIIGVAVFYNRGAGHFHLNYFLDNGMSMSSGYADAGEFSRNNPLIETELSVLSSYVYNEALSQVLASNN